MEHEKLVCPTLMKCRPCPSVSSLLLAGLPHTVHHANAKSRASHDWQPTGGHVLLSRGGSVFQPKLRTLIQLPSPTHALFFFFFLPLSLGNNKFLLAPEGTARRWLGFVL